MTNYAIISRIENSETGKAMIVIGGSMHAAQMPQENSSPIRNSKT
jgi:hypothetical protein